MTSTENLNHARRYLEKAQDYLDSAQDNLDLERLTPAAGDAIHAGINAKDAIVTALTGTTAKRRDHARAASELRHSLSARPDAAQVEKALRELIAMKGDVEYGTRKPSTAQATSAVRRARSLVDVAREIVLS